MNRTRRLDNQLQALTTLISELRRRLPAAVAHATDLAADGWPAGGGQGPTGKGSISDPTANAVMARTSARGGMSLTDSILQLEQAVATAAVGIGDALTVVDRLQPRPGTTPRCSGGAGLDGSMDWGDPTCTNVPDGRPSYQGLCNACYQRKRRHDSEPRTAA